MPVMKQLWVSGKDIVSAINFQPTLVLNNWPEYKTALEKHLDIANTPIKVKDESAKIIVFVAVTSMNFELFKLAYQDEDVTDYIGYWIESNLLTMHKDIWELFNLFRLSFRDGKYNQTDSYNILSAQSYLMVGLLKDDDVFEQVMDNKQGPLFAITDYLLEAIPVSSFLTSLSEPWANIAKYVSIAISNKDMKMVAKDSANKLAHLIHSLKQQNSISK